MALWVIKPGRRGEHEDYFLSRQVVCLTFADLPRLDDITSPEAMKGLFLKMFPALSIQSRGNYTAQTWAFRGISKVGDLIAMPLKSSVRFVVGRIRSEYQYDRNCELPYRHQRSVNWHGETFSRCDLDVDLRYSLATKKTFCRARTPQAENRFHHLLEDNSLPKESQTFADADSLPREDRSENGSSFCSLRRHIERHFSGDDLADLVAELLRMEGFLTFVAPRGKDGGRDILAARGPFAFEPPRICVQVKRTTKPADVHVLRCLIGSMHTVAATHGILVSWSGFTRDAYREAAPLHFTIRLIDGNQLLQSILPNYSRLSLALQQKLPRRVPDEFLVSECEFRDESPDATAFGLYPGFPNHLS